MRLPSLSPVPLDWPKAASEQWAQLVLRSRRLEASVGRGDAFEEMLAKLRAMASTGKFGGLRELLRRRIAARALTWLWLEGDALVLRLFNSTMLDALIDAQKPRLTRITFLQLVQLYFREFDCLDARDNQSGEGLRKALEEHLFWQLAEIPASRYANGRPDAISALKREAHWLIGADGPKELATRTRSQGKELAVAFAEFGLSGFDVGRYGDVCRAHFYLERLRTMPVGQWDEVFDELLKPAVAKAPFEGDRRIGHAALELLIDRAGTDPGDAWQSFILGLAGDPRISSRAPSYQEWWRPLGDERIQRVRGWLSKEDLRLFLQAVEQYGQESRNFELQRMFAARKVFLEGLFKLGLIRNTRLMLGRTAHESVKRILSSDVKTNFARLDGVMKDKAVIYLDCGDFHLVEGSHSFKIWIYLAPPGKSLLSYDKNSFSHSELTRGLLSEYRTSHPALPCDSVVHSSMWQRKVFDFLAANGIALDIEKLLTRQEYKVYLSNYGLPVVNRSARAVAGRSVTLGSPAAPDTQGDFEAVGKPQGFDLSIRSIEPQTAATVCSTVATPDDSGGKGPLSVVHMAVLEYLHLNPRCYIGDVADVVVRLGGRRTDAYGLLTGELNSYTKCVNRTCWSLSAAGEQFLDSRRTFSQARVTESHVSEGDSILASLGDFEMSVLRYIASHPGQKIRRAAIDLGADSMEVNRVVYGSLKKFCTQDKDYGWSVNDEVFDALEQYPEA